MVAGGIGRGVPRGAALWITIAMGVAGGVSAPPVSSQWSEPLPEAILSDTPVTHDATVGTAAGEAGVSGGGATYQIAIEVPPGRLGMQPSLSLGYSSRAGNGVAGLGWSVSGLSGIHRCPQTLAQDGATRAVAFDANDRLCLDGQRLMRVEGSAYGLSGAVYRTEVDSFARVTQRGGDLTGGSACFTVEYKSGRIAHLGAVVAGTACQSSSRNARVQPTGVSATLSWLVEKEEDRVGNNQFFTYTNHGNGEVLIQRIDYTGYQSTAGDRQVSFTYGARPTASGTEVDNDVSASFVGGGLTAQTQRLTQIDTWVGSSRVRAWKLGYANPSSWGTVSRYSGRSVLQTVTDCAYTPGEVCHPATVLETADGVPIYTLREMSGTGLPGVDQQPAPVDFPPPGGGAPGGVHRVLSVGDLDGDGSREFMVNTVNSGSPFATFLFKTYPDRTYSSTAIDVSSLGVSYSADAYIDFDGNGSAEIVKTLNGTDPFLRLLVWKLGRGGWPAPPASPFLDVATNVPRPAAGRVQYGDFDGDGLTDFAVDVADAACGSGYRMKIWLNRISGPLVVPGGTPGTPGTPGASATFVQATEEGNPGVGAPLLCIGGYTSSGVTHVENILRVFDFDGNGASDMLLSMFPPGTSGTNMRLVGIRRGSTANAVALTTANSATTGIPEMPTSGMSFWMDVNGDGLEDLVRPENGRWSVRLNRGGRLSAALCTDGSDQLATSGSCAGPTYALDNTAAFGYIYAGMINLIDVDSDGRQELLVPVDVAVGFCTKFFIPPTPGNICRAAPEVPAAPHSLPFPTCSDVYMCPSKPGNTANIYPSAEFQNWGLYQTDGLGPTYDQSTYKMNPLQFVVGPVQTATGLPSIRIRKLDHEIVGSNPPEDAYGDGLEDVITVAGCRFADCAPSTGFSGLLDASMASLAANRRLYINENKGLGLVGVTSAVNRGLEAEPQPETAPHPLQAAAGLGYPLLPDLLTRAFNGIGDWAHWVYAPLGYPGLYTIPAEGYADPQHYYFTSSMPVVHSLNQSSGRALEGFGFRMMDLRYSEAMYNRLGRGFQGFRTIASVNGSTDGTRQVWTTTTYHQKFPLAGQVQSVSQAPLSQPNYPFATTTYDWRCNRSLRSELCPMERSVWVAPTPGTVYAPYLDRELAIQNDLASAESGSTVEVGRSDTINAVSAGATVSGWDAYGNLKDQVVQRKDSGSGGIFVNSHTTTTANVYTTNTTTWWLDRLDSTTVTTSIGYSLAHGLPSSASAPNQTVQTTYSWNADRTPSTQILQPFVTAQQVQTQYAYPATSYGNPSSVTVIGSNASPASRTTGFTYSSDGTTTSADGYFVLETTNPLSQTTRTEHRPRDGQVARLTAPSGLQTVSTYDGFGRATRIDYLTASSATLEPSTYISLTRCTSGSCPGGYGESVLGQTYAAWRQTVVRDGAPTQATWYDPLGREVKQATRAFDGISFVRVLSQYDLGGTLSLKTVPHMSYDSAPYATTYEVYDALGRLKRKTADASELDALNGDVVTSYVYTGTKTAIKVRGSNVSGLGACATGALCMDMARYYDVLGRLVKTEQAKDGNATYAVARYWYDGLGNPVAAQDAGGHVIRASYTPVGQRTQLVDPDAGTWDFTYDGFGQQLSYTDARGVLSTTAYDALGRPTLRGGSNPAGAGLPSENISDTWVYDPVGNPGALQYQLRRRGSGLPVVWREDYAYDTTTKRLSTTTTTIGSTVLTTQHQYDTLGRPNNTIYPSGLQAKKDYNATGYYYRLLNGFTNAVYWEATSQDAWGNVMTEAYGSGMQATHLHHASTGQLKSQEWRAYVPTAVVRDRQDYSYDSFGNLKTHKRTLGSQVATETMSYDALQRLTGTERTLCTGGLCTGAVTVSYGYEANGNLSYKSDLTPAVAGSYTYGANGCGPHAVSGLSLAGGGARTYSCDANGNVINGSVFGTNGAVYDFQNQARKVSRQSFGGVGDTTFEMATTSQRYREVRGSGETILFGPGGFELVTAGGVTSYRHELGPIVVNTTGGTNTERYVLRDRLGSTAALSPPDQSISDRRAYDPYGKVRNGDFTDFGAGQLQLNATTFRGFTSHEHVDNLQLIHMNGRLFDYHLGRFYQVDPVVQFPTNSQSLNPYSYLMNNPFAGTDPSGYCQKDLGSNICSQGDDVTLTATFSSGKTQNLGTFNTNKSKDIAQARGVKLGGNGVQSMSPTGAGGLKEQAAGVADKGAKRNQSTKAMGASLDIVSDVLGNSRASRDSYDEGAELAIEPLRQRALDITYREAGLDGIVDLKDSELREVFSYEIARVGMRSRIRGGYENLGAYEFGLEAKNHGDSLFFGDNGGRLYRIEGKGPYFGGNINYINQGIIFAAGQRSLDQALSAVKVWNYSGAGSVKHLEQRLYFTEMGYGMWREGGR